MAGWWLVLAGLLTGLFLGGLLLANATPLYSSSTRLFVVSSGGTDPSAAYESSLFTQQRALSYAQLITGQELASRVVDELGLRRSPADLADQVTATAVPETVILEVTVTDRSPRVARDIAASLTRQFTGFVATLESPSESAGSPIQVRTIEAARIDPDPVSPDPVRHLASGGVLGLAAGLGLAIARARRDTTIRRVVEVSELTGAELIGSVPEDRRLAARRLVTELDQPSRTIEGFRMVRTHLQLLGNGNPPRVLTVTAAMPGDGASTVAVNLAIVLAQAGNRVLLIDADLRRPRVTRYLNLVAVEGLTDVLAGRAGLDDVVFPDVVGKLSVLAAGPMPTDPTQMVGSAEMRALLSACREAYDYVVIDAPALLAVPDALAVSALSDGCLLTVGLKRTRREQLSDAVAALSRLGIPIVGVVLNRAPKNAVALRGRYGRPGYRADRERLPDAVADDADSRGDGSAQPGRAPGTEKLV